MKKKNLRFYKNCVGMNGNRRDVESLNMMIDKEQDITRRTFLQYVDRDDLRRLETLLGYEQHPSQGLTMAGDWHVAYYKSHWKFTRCYFFRHSSIEYVFAECGEGVPAEGNPQERFAARGW